MTSRELAHATELPDWQQAVGDGYLTGGWRPVGWNAPPSCAHCLAYRACPQTRWQS